MRPHSRECGRLALALELAHVEEASMRPHSRECGRVMNFRDIGISRTSGFNEPHSRECGRLKLDVAVVQHDLRASMRPHSRECGRVAPARKSLYQYWLQ